MEKITYEGNQNRIEGFLLIMYTIYTAGIIISAGRASLENWTDISLLAALLSSWLLYLCKYKDYRFRATYTSVMMQISLILYTFYERDLRYALPVYIVFVVMVGLYGIAQNIFLTVLTTAIVFFYHIFVIQTIPLQNLRDVVSLIQRLSNVLFVEFLVFVWTKRNYEGSKKLLKVIEELEKVESSKDDFVANVSHEIRTPINTICGMSEMVLREELSGTVREKVRDIQRAGRNLMGGVSDILDYSELQSEEIELEEEVYNISSTIVDVIDMAMAYKGDKKIEIIVNCDPTLPCELMGDEKKLRRVILKLINNAIKFTESGCVTLSIGYRKESYGINLFVAIKDSGIGIREENLEKLFTSFNQVDASRKRQEGGLGLGLAISQALIQKMGGTITVKSKLKKGTTVKFVIPQKVMDETPIAFLHQKENIDVAVYLDMEQFEIEQIRDEYSEMIWNMVEKLKGRCHVCRSLAELLRRNEKAPFSHIFISTLEYNADRDIFDALAEKIKVIVVLEQKEERKVTNPNIFKIYKPFYIMPIVSVLNGNEGASRVNYGNEISMKTRNTRVLVVDDNSMNIRVVEEMLSVYKIEVDKAYSGQEALEKITSMNYDFVFMDHMMPEMDGVECLHRIRQKNGNYYHKVPIIALTANAVAGTRERLLQEGFNDFLEKPIERSVLERVLRRTLPIDKIIEVDSNAEVTVEKAAVKKAGDWLEVLEQLGLDIEHAFLYCGGKESYYKILQGYSLEGEKIEKQLKELYEHQDWKNYTIVVHGLKSAMGSIGAKKVSEQAKQLEMAGKKGDISYILTHHEGLLQEYTQLFAKLRENGIFKEATVEKEKVEKAVKTSEEELWELDDEDFAKIFKMMEDAVYDLNNSLLMETTEDLKMCSYKGKPLKDIMIEAQRKIEMSDCFSALDMISNWKDKNQR